VRLLRVQARHPRRNHHGSSLPLVGTLTGGLSRVCFISRLRCALARHPMSVRYAHDPIVLTRSSGEAASSPSISASDRAFMPGKRILHDRCGPHRIRIRSHGTTPCAPTTRPYPFITLNGTNSDIDEAGRCPARSTVYACDVNASRWHARTAQLTRRADIELTPDRRVHGQVPRG
jgi:hypothetical protein